MKKIITLVILLVIMIFGFSSSTMTSKANNDDFDDFTFTAQLKFMEADKTNCIITWKTKKMIKYLNVNVILPNNFEQNPYQSGRENCAGIYTSTYEDGYYLNTLEFDVYYYQLGNIKTEFTYSYDYVIDETSSDIRTCTCVFVTGNWVEEQPIYIAIIVGIVITLFIVLATYVIIENSRKNLLNKSSSNEDGLIDDDDIDPIQNRTRKVIAEDE